MKQPSLAGIVAFLALAGVARPQQPAANPPLPPVPPSAATDLQAPLSAPASAPGQAPTISASSPGDLGQAPELAPRTHTVPSPTPPSVMFNSAQASAATPADGITRSDLLIKMELAEMNRALSRQAEEGVKMTEGWARKSDLAQTQSPTNGSVVMRFNASLPTIMGAVLELTDIEFQAGEVITSVNVGDTLRWVISSASSREGELKRPHLIIKPMDEGLKTSLVVTTNKRSYHMTLQSSFDLYMHHVTFSYPEDPEDMALKRRLEETEAIARRKVEQEAEAARRKAEAEKSVAQRKAEQERQEELASLPKPLTPGPPLPTVAYQIKGKAPWKPLSVYTDGVKTYILMPESMKNAEAPSLLLLRQGKRWTLFGSQEKVLVNYRVQGNWYVVDSVIDRALLVIGREEVTLTRTDVVPTVVSQPASARKAVPYGK